MKTKILKGEIAVHVLGFDVFTTLRCKVSVKTTRALIDINFFVIDFVDAGFVAEVMLFVG